MEKDPRFVAISDRHEHYKFIYNRQQMPLESFKPSTIEAMSYQFLVFVFVGIIVVLGVATWLFTRKIGPFIARMRKSQMVEEDAP